jgi:hydroxypyruvate reductase
VSVRERLVASFRAAVAATDPGRLVAERLPSERPALVLAVGKAALPMVEAVEAAFPGVPGLATAPDGHGGPTGSVEVVEAAHPVPDERSVAAAARALELARGLGEDDLLLVLVSGGGSALWCAPAGLSLADKRATTHALLRSGAGIAEMNAVRKHLSAIKGGRLAAATRARVLALVLSDVPGDDLATVASGPTVPDPTTFADALAVLDAYGLDAAPARAALARGLRGEAPESPTALPRAKTRVVGSAWHLLEAARGWWEAEGDGARVAILSDRFTGEARELARVHADLVRSIRAHGAPFAPPVVLLSGGEASVTVRGGGRGGRNQELALWLAWHLGPEAGVWGIACDSDGIDGNTEAAGAIVAPDTLARAAAAGLDVRAALGANDAHAVFAALGDLVVTGPTRSNLNDYRAIVVT